MPGTPTQLDFRFVKTSSDFEAGSGNAIRLSAANRAAIAASSAANHAQNSDTKLGEGTSNEITAAQLKSLYTTLSGLVVNGKIVDGFIPALAISSVRTVASIAARDALTAEEGDVAVVTDAGDGFSRSYIFSDQAVWLEIKAPDATVRSVNGEVGDVVLVAGDIALTTPSGMTADDLQAFADEIAASVAALELFNDSLGGSGGADLVGYDNSDTAVLAGQATVQDAIHLLDSLVGAAGADITTLEGRVSATEEDIATLTTTTLPGIVTTVGTAQTAANLALSRQNFFREDKVTLSSGQIAAKSITLTHAPISTAKVHLSINGGALQNPSVDFSVTSTTLSWDSLGLDGVLVAGDVLFADYVR